MVCHEGLECGAKRCSAGVMQGWRLFSSRYDGTVHPHGSIDIEICLPRPASALHINPRVLIQRLRDMLDPRLGVCHACPLRESSAGD